MSSSTSPADGQAARLQREAIAEELKRRRKGRSLTIEQLAQSSGVSKSMISKIERAESTPSTLVLSKLGAALGVTFSELMAAPAEEEFVLIPAGRQPVLRDQASGFVRRCLSPVLPGRGIDWILGTLPPAASSGELVAHRPGVAEYVFVTKGRLSVRIRDRVILVDEGDSLYFEAGVEHAFTNAGASECQYFRIIDTSRVV